MYRRVLIAVDGSNSSNTAAVVAARLGLVGPESRVTLLGVVDLGLIERLIKPPGKGEFQEKVQAFERDALIPVKETLEEMTGAEVDITVADGPTADFIVGVGQRIDADLVVVGRRDRSLLEWLTSSSVGKKVLASRQHTLLVVPQESAGLRDGPLRALVPFDVSSDADRALDEVAGLAAGAGEVEVELLYCQPPPTTPIAGFVEPVTTAATLQSFEKARREAFDQARESLREQARELSDRGLRATLSVSEGPIAHGICEAAEEHRQDLIVIGARDRGLFERLVRGDTAGAVAANSAVPVLVVPEPEEAEAASMA